ncbi:hypothetical protein F3Y22_tig00110247pilonHSYRG00038 [Hibiscus syriacus]|uniref:RRP12 N-terminal HEAT domain-containing protein n=1 Tax=Hibiscus syriacus TaxID=106335 RepID=A0A6A3B5X1_HIBSY|nr:hypothetical protein F3Y22_tig00110247pilonHSYRG00038 [Hibiscus syriacus]
MEGIELEGFDQFPDSPTGDFAIDTPSLLEIRSRRQPTPLRHRRCNGSRTEGARSASHTGRLLRRHLFFHRPSRLRTGFSSSRRSVSHHCPFSLLPRYADVGFEMLSSVMIVGDKVNWSDISQNYSVMIGYLTDSHSKVRRQSHLCIRDVLQSFRGMPVLAPASEAISNMLERFLLLAGGSNANSSEGAKGAQEVLYV